MCHYTYFYILSTIVGKVSGFDGATPCHWSGLRLQLDSQPLEGDGASSCCWLSSGSVSSDRKLGNVCARGMKVIVRPLPVGKKKGEELVALSPLQERRRDFSFIDDASCLRGFIFSEVQLLSYSSCWSLYMQKRGHKNNPGIIWDLWCGWFSHNNAKINIRVAQ